MPRSTEIRILTCYYRPKPGGFCTRYFRAIQALLDQGCVVHYLAVERFPVEHPDCRFHRFPWPRGRTDTLLFWAVFHLLAPWMLLYLGIRQKISHGFAFGSTYGFFLQPLRMLKQVPLLVFLRGDPVAHHRSAGRASWVIRLELVVEGVALYGARVLAVSDALATKVSERHRICRPVSLTTLRNDIPFSGTRLSRRKRGPVSAACAGVFEAHKNQRLLIDVMDRLEGENICLNLYGQGRDEAGLRNRIRSMKHAGRVRLAGWVAATEIWQSTDLVLMPSRFEGAPNVVLEALGQGIPVLASDIPAHREILPAGCLLDPQDSRAWCRRLQEIAADPETGLAALTESQQTSRQMLMFDWNQRVFEAVTGLPLCRPETSRQSSGPVL